MSGPSCCPHLQQACFSQITRFLPTFKTLDWISRVFYHTTQTTYLQLCLTLRTEVARSKYVLTAPGLDALFALVPAPVRPPVALLCGCPVKRAQRPEKPGLLTSIAQTLALFADADFPRPDQCPRVPTLDLYQPLSSRDTNPEARFKSRSGTDFDAGTQGVRGCGARSTGHLAPKSMTSTSFAARPREARDARDSAGTQPQSVEAQNGTGIAENNNTHNNRNDNNHARNNSSDTVLHAHRQNHNSSKLPAYRFADLGKDRISLPSLQQPAPLAPVVVCDTADPRRSSTENGLHHHTSAQTLPDRTASLEPKQTGGTTRTRSLKFHLPSTAASTESSPAAKRPKSFPINNAPSTESPLSPVAVVPAVKRRLTESAVKELVQGRRELPQAKTGDKTSRPPVSSASQKLLNTLNTSNTASAVSAASTSGGRAVIPPIRSFRSSGSRKGAPPDMPARQDSYDEDTGAFNPRDRTLRALQGQQDDDFSHLAPFESGEMTTTTDNDNTADIFMKIAKEDPPLRAADRQQAEPSVVVRSARSGEGTPNSIPNISQSRVVRTSHRRPLSTTVPAHEVPSPPQMSRRLSDQRDNSRTRHAVDSPAAQPSPRESPYRASGRDNLPTITTTAEHSPRTQQQLQQGRTPPRPPPVTPRQISFKDSFAETSSAYQRRRQSLTENNSLSGSRAAPQYRSPNFALAQSRTYHSSPLVPKSANVQADVPQNSDANHGVEGTESSSSTAAPSTVWDELDDLKSRIHRLERTGKSTTGGAVSRSSEERPRTATTNATTVSASPKRSGTGSAQAEVPSLPAMPRETQPLLLSALGKTRDLVSPEVFSAIESAANDALALSSMIGTVGQPGPISSSASTIGGYNGSITDRQLRKKADSVCRSLTELCLALADPTGQQKQPPTGQQKQPQPPTLAPEPEPLLSSTSTNATLHAATPQRRPSAIAEILAKASTSDRAPTSLEQKRKTMLASTSLPSSRSATAPSTPLESNPGRKSSLLLARIRRTTGGEEAEESPQAGRRSSLLLRSRRTGSEEPEEIREGRKTSLLLRTRKTLEEEDESRFRVPSRAITEVNTIRTVPRDLAIPATTAPQTPAEISPTTSTVLPRRRLIPSAISTRFAAAAPAASAPTTPARKYLERSSTAQDRGTPQERTPYLERSIHQERGPINSISERLAEERGQPQQRQISLSQSAMLGRANSLGRRTREINSLRS